MHLYQFKSSDKELISYNGLSSQLVSSLEEITEIGSGILILNRDVSQVQSLIQAILQLPQGYLFPIFTLIPPGKVYESFVYELESNTSPLETLKFLDQRFQLLPTKEVTDPEDKLLQWLFLHEGAQVEPVFDPNSEVSYRYPLAELLGGEDHNTYFWLASMAKRNLLSEGELVNRIRLCAKCDTHNINMIDQCPACNHIDIVEKNFIHCFNCGHVDDEKSFRKDQSMRCQNCSTTLRHIGSDYDRAMSQYKCNQCQHIFADPKVVAACLACEAETEPQNLTMRKVLKFELSQEGRIAVRTGRSVDLFATLDDARFISSQHLSSLITWYHQLSVRHEEFSAHVVVMTITNVAELMQETGRYTIVTTIEEFVQRLREKLRTTDLAARLSDHAMAMFLPQMKPEFISIIEERIEELRKEVQIGTGKQLDIRWEFKSIPKDVSTTGEANELLDSLLNQLEVSD